MTKVFTAHLGRFADLTKRKTELVLKQSAQDVFERAQLPKARGGNMPIDTGYLTRDSFVAGLNGQVMASGAADAYVAVIAGMELGDSMFGGWRASYARHVEYGTSKMAGSFFAMNAVQNWQAIVAANAAKARQP